MQNVHAPLAFDIDIKEFTEAPKQDSQVVKERLEQRKIERESSGEKLRREDIEGKLVKAAEKRQKNIQAKERVLKELSNKQDHVL